MMRAGLLLLATSAAVVAQVAARPEKGGVWVELLVDNRTSDVFMPTCSQTRKDNPIILNLHAWFSGTEMQETTDLFAGFYGGETPFPGPECAILVYPQGLLKAQIRGWPIAGLSWNAGGCCPGGTHANVPDVQYLQMVIDGIAKVYGGSEENVFVVGVSNGGMMANRLACEDSRIKALVSVAGPLVNGTYGAEHTSTFKCPNRVPVLHVHGMADPIVPYNGCTQTTGGTECELLLKTLDGDIALALPIIPDYIKDWRKRNGQTMSEAGSVGFVNNTANCTSWGDAASNVTLCTLEKMGHAWPGRCSSVSKFFGPAACAMDIDASYEALVFMKRYTTATKTKGKAGVSIIV